MVVFSSVPLVELPALTVFDASEEDSPLEAQPVTDKANAPANKPAKIRF